MADILIPFPNSEALRADTSWPRSDLYRHHRSPMNQNADRPLAPHRAAPRSLAPNILPLLLVVTMLSACGADAEGAPEAAGPDIRYGPEIAIGNGNARTYVILDGSSPIEVGVALSAQVLEGLPADGAHGGMTMPDGHSTFEHVLEMPATNPTPFRHVTLDWNPAGHEPPGVYDHSHFDVHFFTIANEERLAINPGDPEFMAKGGNLPPAEQLPAGYIDPGIGPVPLMGVHWVDPTSPELAPENPAQFTRTLIYGSWDGRMIFVEPMVTTAFLASRPSERLPAPVAARYDPAGYYPETYIVEWNAGANEYRIGLGDLEARD